MIKFLLDFCVYNTIEILFENIEFFLIIKILIIIYNDIIFYILNIKHMRCV